MASRFVRPDTRTLTLEDGETLVVRARLTAGDDRLRFNRMWLASDGKTLNPAQVALSTVTAYLLDWSFRDDEGRTVKIRDLPVSDLEQVLDNLTVEAYAEIVDAVLTHANAMDDERTAEKKTRSGARGSDPTSPSPPSSDGGTNGSGTLTRMSLAS